MKIKKILSLIVASVILSMSGFHVFAANITANPTTSKVIVNGVEKKVGGLQY